MKDAEWLERAVHLLQKCRGNWGTPLSHSINTFLEEFEKRAPAGGDLVVSADRTIGRREERDDVEDWSAGEEPHASAEGERDTPSSRATREGQ